MSETIPQIILTFKPEISIIEDAEKGLILKAPYIDFNLNKLSPGIVAAIKVISTAGATETALTQLVVSTDGSSALAKFYYYLEQFVILGLVYHTLEIDGSAIATAVPIATPYKWQLSDTIIDNNYQLSRFAYCHSEKSHLVVESPLSKAKIILEDWRSAALINELSQPKAISDLTKIPGISEATARLFISFLSTAELLSSVNNNSSLEQSETLTQWEFHDLLFHSRSRGGRHSNQIGKTFRFLGEIEPTPVLKAKPSNEIINLYKPDIDSLKQTDTPFTAILESRKTIRQHGEKPITVEQLGEFLYRSARLREIVPRDNMDCSNRPYPTGGACYDLEIYTAINSCENIEAGLYYYAPQEHQLCKISGKTKQVEALLKSAGLSVQIEVEPQILILLSSRFSRVTWGYESMAYSLILKHVGILYQTMYLVATAMNLAPSGVGGGNSELFAAAAGCDYFAESSVGEFILGSR
ncbi:MULTISPECIES: SagB family peptide dehydrogenase [unclassified Microcoleus]|uniref:SagB family peptide dehydrogenase n=1 Tax=unclassified Microcoleus TaxID=2642155 RepID=UPI002FD758D8